MKSRLASLYLKHKLIIYPLVSVLIALIVIIFVIIPQVKAFLTNQQTLQETTKKRQVLEVKANELEKLDGPQLNQQLSTALAALPVEKDFTGVIGSIQRLTTQSGFSLISLTVTHSQVGSAGASGFTMEIEVSGPKLGFEGLLKNIETAVPTMKVSSIEISSQITEVIGANLQVDVFYSPAPVKLGAVDEALPILTEEDQKILTNLAQLVPPREVATTPVILTPRGKANPFQ